MKTTTIASCLLLCLFFPFACGEKSKGDADAVKNTVTLEKQLLGKWRMIGFQCDREGKCQKEIKDGTIRLAFTEDGKFYESQYNQMDYKVSGNTIQFGSAKGKEFIQGTLSMDILFIKGKIMLAQWSYKKQDNIYTEYEKVQ